MRRIVSIAALLSILCGVRQASAQVTIDEAKVRARLQAGATVVVLAIDNTLPKAVAARISLTWISPNNTVGAKKDIQQEIAPGKSAITIPLPLWQEIDPMVGRLRYSISPDTANLTAFSARQGILAFSQIAEHAFTLSAAGIGDAREGRPYEIRVFAAHPVTNAPAKGVALTIDEDSTNEKKQRAITDANGVAVFKLKPDPEEWDAGDMVTVEGKLGDFKQSIEVTRPGVLMPRLQVQFDKPLYQPGQTLHFRMVALGRDHRARADARYSLRIVDDRDAVQFAKEVKTSRFGIASADWEIPEHAKSGKYQLEIHDEQGDRDGRREIEIRRYDLPSFRVNVKPDRAFYLPGQNAAVEIRADYLFGKSLSGGKVRLVEGDDGTAILESSLDGAGHARAVVDLKEQQGLGDKRYLDLHFTAFVTDESTNRTEQRRFDLRVSRDAIHLYWLHGRASKIPVPFFVSTYSADGKAVECDVEILADDKVIAKARSNRYGVARFVAALPEGEITARAIVGGVQYEQTGEVRDAGVPINIETDRSLYRVGESIRCTITSDRTHAPAMLLGWRDGQVLFSRAIDLKSGRAQVTVPYQTNFGRSVSLAAVGALGSNYQIGRTVLYPGPEDLHVVAHTAKDTYRPGETGSLSLAASLGNGIPIESAFGVAIVDQAVFERAETDRATNHRRWLYESDFDSNSLGGFTIGDLMELDPAKITPELQVVAGALLDTFPIMVDNDDFASDLDRAFSRTMVESLSPVQKSIESRYQNTLEFPTDEAELSFIAGAAYSKARDPWDRPYHAEFSVEGTQRIVQFISSGPDKQVGGGDDLVALRISRDWFFTFHQLIQSSLRQLIDYPASVDEAIKIISDGGVNFAALRDPWGNPLRLSIEHHGNMRSIDIDSAGPDHRFGTRDDVRVAWFQGTYFQEMKDRMDRALDAATTFPSTERDFAAAMSAAGIDFNALRDPWGRAYRLKFDVVEQFSDRIQLYTAAEYQGLPQQRHEVIPVKRKYQKIQIRSDGEDRIQGTYDDVSVAEFSRLLDETATAPASQPVASAPAATIGGRGSLAGVVLDASGAMVDGSQVTLRIAGDPAEYKTQTDARGRFSFRGVPPGMYTLIFEHVGFQRHVVSSVPVRADHVTTVDGILQVGGTAETVEVQAAPVQMNTESAQVSQVAEQIAISTPHVRDYFPETLLWQPELISDKSGRANLNFKFPDSITAWHVAVVASTIDGRMTEVGTEVKSFQPFFADLAPPQVLTVGDDITLPVPIRNYLTTEEPVSAEAIAASALSIVERPKALRIGAGASANAIFRMRAASAGDVKLRVTARGKTAADAIEKPIAIHPDGEPVARSVSDLVENGRLLRLEVPTSVVPGSIRGEVKFYPSLLAQVIESAEAMLRIPTGCGEQTISSAYPNLLFLKALATSGLHDDALERRARRNLQIGYRRLIDEYRKDDGGFAYWPHSEADVALTAYALGFQEDAKPLIAVDDAIVDAARAWLAKQNPVDKTVRALTIRELARAGAKYESIVIDRLGELAREAASFDDPYRIAVFALAAMDASKPEVARPAIERLRNLVRREEGMAYWDLRANTPYFGWGRAGRVEATAMVVTAIERWRSIENQDAQIKALLDQGVLFLLRNKDPMGLWHNTQATARTLAALFATLGGVEASKPFTAEIRMNGARVASVTVPGADALRGPLTVDVGRFLKPGVVNELSISVPANTTVVQAEFNANWYEKWAQPKSSPDVALSVQYSSTRIAPNELVQCEATVSRPSFKGYGMMIAEIGLPPGADVDRGSLTDLVNDWKSGVDSFEIAPDSVIFYVWPRAADSKIRFSFRPRFEMNAQSEASVVYDYYNPDARAVVPPATFVVR